MQTFNIGNGTVELWHEGPDYSPEDSGYRQRYAYRITVGTRLADWEKELLRATGHPIPEYWEYVGNDIRSGVGAGVDEGDMARSLFSFLSACAESREYRDRFVTDTNGLPHGENADLFPDYVGRWAEQYSDEIALLSLDPSDLE